MEFLSVDDEKCLLGAMLLNNSVIENVYNVVKPSTFSNDKNKIVYETILFLRQKGVQADISTVYKEVLDKGVDAGYVAELTDTVCSSTNWKYYADRVKNKFLQRAAYQIIVEAKDDIEKNRFNEKYDAQELINQLNENISSVTKDVVSTKCYNMKDLIKNEIGYIQDCMNNKKEWLGYDTGFPGFNNIINGLQSVYMIIGARPSMGKTALAQKIALNLSESVKTVFIELEMSPRQLTERAISNLTKISFRKIQSGFITQNAMTKLLAQMDKLSQNNNFIPCESPTRQLSDIVNTCRNQVRNNDAKVIFIDHIGLIRCNYGSQIYEKTRYISNTLQQLQRELDVPIVVLSQLGRESESSKNSNLASFRGSGAIEEDADICVFINRDRAKEQSDTDIPTEIVVAKNRDGAVGSVKMLFKPEIVDFIDLSQSYNDRKMQQEIDNMQNKEVQKPIQSPRKVQSDYTDIDESNPFEYDIF